jgi:hypothetical protein
MNERAAVWLTVLVVITSAAGIGAMPLSQSATGPDTTEIKGDGAGTMGVQNIQLVEQQRGVLRYAVEYSGSLDRSYLQRSLVRAVDHDRIDASSIRVTEVESHVATVEVATNGSENPQTVASRMLRAMQLTSPPTQSPATSTTDGGTSANTSADASTGGNGKAKNAEEDETYYQIDFVQGEPIENLQGPEGTYRPDELIRYAHGSTENPLKRSSDGEFTTNESLAECVESSAIVVKSDGTARVSFKIADGCDPVTLSLVSYTKPGPVWSRATESEQEFVDADTRTFEPGGTYTLRVELPPTEDSTTTAATSSESSATERPETDTATETEEAATDSEPDRTSTPTPTVEVQPQPTPTLTPSPTPATSTSSAATSTDTETPGSSMSEGTAGSQGSSQQTEATDDPPAPSTPEPPTTTESGDSDGGSTPTDTPTDDSGDDSPSSPTPTESPTTTDDSSDGGDQTAATTTDPVTEEPTTTDDGDDSTPTTTEPPETSTTEPTTTEPPETTETSTETTAEPTTEPPTTTETPETTTTTQPTTEEPTTEPPTTTESPETTTTTETDEPTTEPPTTTETTAPTTQPTTTTETTETTTTEEPTTTTTEGPPEGGNSAEVLFNDQSLEESLRVVAESVTLPSDSNGGFLIAYDAANFGEVDRPDDRIGVSEKLASGNTESVQVDLQFANASVNERVTVVVVRDSNGNGQYDPGVDTGALNEEGQIASDSAEVSIAVGLLPDPPDDGGDDNGSDSGSTTTTTTTSDESGGDNESGDGGGILSSEATDAAEAESAEQNASATNTTTTTDPAENTDEEASTPENEGMKTTVTKSAT